MSSFGCFLLFLLPIVFSFENTCFNGVYTITKSSIENQTTIEPKEPEMVCRISARVSADCASLTIKMGIGKRSIGCHTKGLTSDEGNVSCYCFDEFASCNSPEWLFNALSPKAEEFSCARNLLLKHLDHKKRDFEQEFAEFHAKMEKKDEKEGKETKRKEIDGFVFLSQLYSDQTAHDRFGRATVVLGRLLLPLLWSTSFAYLCYSFVITISPILPRRRRPRRSLSK